MAQLYKQQFNDDKNNQVYKTVTRKLYKQQQQRICIRMIREQRRVVQVMLTTVLLYVGYVDVVYDDRRWRQGRRHLK